MGSDRSRAGPVGLAVATGALLLAAVGVGAWAVSRLDVRATAETGAAVTSAPTTAPPTTGAPTTTAPPTTTTTPPARLAPEPPIPTATGPYAFVETETDGDPAAWDPCRPIRFVTNARRAPPGAPEIVAEAMARVTEATGLVFEDLGATDEAPAASRPYVRPERYGTDYAPVLLAWTDETEIPDFAGVTNGRASPGSTTSSEGEQVDVTGTVLLDGADAAGRIAAGDREGVLAVVVHELGHLVGLDHVDDPGEVMYGGGVQTSTWGPGDRAGLARVGRGECIPALWR